MIKIWMTDWLKFFFSIFDYRFSIFDFIFSIFEFDLPEGLQEGGCWIFLVIFLLTHFKVMIFLLTQTMRLNGCLKEKINVIRPLENFLRHFEKKSFNTFWTKMFGKSWKIFRKISFQNFPQKFFWWKFLISDAFKIFLKHFSNTFWVWKMFSKITAIQCALNRTYTIHLKKDIAKKGKQL